MRYTSFAAAGFLSLTSAALAGSVLSNADSLNPPSISPNTGSGFAAVVAGGSNNTASGGWSGVASGYNNRAEGLAANIAGGAAGQAVGNYTFVGGGYGNNVSGIGSGIVGGVGNIVAGQFSGVLSGAQNNAQGSFGAIGGGALNRVGIAAIVGGGALNDASGQYSGILGGYGNQSSGVASIIGGGQGNIASGAFSAILNGANNRASGNFSMAQGVSATAAGRGTVLFKDSTSAPFTASVPDSFNAKFDGGIFLNSQAGVFINGTNVTQIIGQNPNNPTTSTVPSESLVQVTPGPDGTLALPNTSRAFEILTGATTFTEVGNIQGSFPAGAIITLVNNTTGTAVAIYDEETSNTNVDLNAPLESLVGRTGVLQLIALPEGRYARISSSLN